MKRLTPRSFAPKKLRARLTVSLAIIVIASGVVSLLISALTRNGMILGRDTVRHLLFGFALRDMVLLAIAAVVLILLLTLTSRSAANPTKQLSKALGEVASGNYDVTVNLSDGVEEFDELQKSFNIMTQELRSNVLLRKDFISSVSHELKTPLSIMSGYAKLLQEGAADDEEREYAGMIAEQSDRLVGLVGNMLRLSRIDNLEIQADAVLFSLDEQVRQAVLLLEPKWSAKRLELNLDLQSIDFYGDEELLFQIWQNLIDNAVKFTPEEGRISVTLKKDAAGVSLRVSDSGIGMSGETLSRVFEQFYRGPGSRGDGSGLGLPLAKKIAELHGGTITAESKPGEGSTFTVTLAAE